MRLCAVGGVHMGLGVAKYAAKSAGAAVLGFLVVRRDVGAFVGLGGVVT